MGGKKGQIAGQMFLYLAGIIVIALIVFFAFRMFSNLNNVSEEFVSTKFQNAIRSDIATLSNAYGSSAVKTYSLPDDFTEICFVDTVNVALSTLDGYPFIKEAINSGSTNNVYLSGRKSFGSFYIADLKLTNFPYFQCAIASNGVVNLKWVSYGDVVSLKSSAYERYCKNADKQDLCKSLDLVFDTGYCIDCCSKKWGCCNKC